MALMTSSCPPLRLLPTATTPATLLAKAKVLRNTMHRSMNPLHNAAGHPEIDRRADDDSRDGRVGQFGLDDGFKSVFRSEHGRYSRHDRRIKFDSRQIENLRLDGR